MRGCGGGSRGVRLAAALLTVGVTFGAARAQTLEDVPLTRTYGAGVHAYFAGDYQRSYDDLTAAIEAGSQDPRCRYFRGLAALRLGRLDEAEADFSEGAELETRALGSWSVSRSLERVQGHDRLQLERHRSRARVLSLRRDREAERRRYSDAVEAQGDVRRRLLPRPIPAPAGTVRNLFDAESEVPTGPAAPVTEEVVAPPPEMELPPPDAAAPAGPAEEADPVPSADGNPFEVGEPAAVEDPVALPEADTPVPVEAVQ